MDQGKLKRNEDKKMTDARNYPKPRHTCPGWRKPDLRRFVQRAKLKWFYCSASYLACWEARVDDACKCSQLFSCPPLSWKYLWNLGIYVEDMHVLWHLLYYQSPSLFDQDRFGLVALCSIDEGGEEEEENFPISMNLYFPSQ